MTVARCGAVRTDVSMLRVPLQERLASHFGRRAIRAVRQRPSPYTSSFRLDNLDVLFVDGTSLRLVMKHAGNGSLVERARRARPRFPYDPERERSAYERILPSAPYGTPACYGELTRPWAAAPSLLLERVRGKPLWQRRRLSSWQAAAAWIARFHRRFPPARARRLAHGARVLVYDEAHYWKWLDRARRFAAGDAERRHALRRIARVYASVVARLSAIPPTLIHGEYYASNVLVGVEQGRVRVCPVDWEMAALGPGLVDLAALSAGWNDAARGVLARAYCAAGGRGTGSHEPDPPRQFLNDLECCALYLAVRMLGWSSRWRPPKDHARNWLAEATRIAAVLER